ncbi:MAG: hypothetical protein JNJ52_04665 [Flavobacterium sp.]|nr:hypothetical protein [Flavobacterium sp.]
MLLIFISWIYIAFTSINLGVGLDKLLKNDANSIVITTMKGLFVATILASFWAIFGRINVEFHIFLLALNSVLFLRFKKEITTIYITFFDQLSWLSKSLQLILALILILILAQCASAPFIIDNESYYIQTIKWLNEYGFVKGVANLHIFFGQTSGWHIAQSAFNFSFLYDNFNDLSGFCLLLGNYFAIDKLHNYFKNRKNHFLVIGLFPIANCFFFQLISAPSTDIPVYVFTFVLFFSVLDLEIKKVSLSTLNWIFILIAFILYIKIMSIGLLMIPLIVVLLNFKSLVPKIAPIVAIGFVTFFIFIVKNTILSGFPLFPTTHFHFSTFDFSVPKEVGDYYFTQNKLYSFFITSSEFQSMSTIEIIWRWMAASKINGIINSLTLLLFLITPYFIKKFYPQKKWWVLYGICFFQLILLLFTSPVYRFFIHFSFFLGCILLAHFFQKKLHLFILFYLSLLPVILVVLFPIRYDALTKNKNISQNSAFEISTILFPHSNSKLSMGYSTEKIGNLTYNSPKEPAYFWVTGNGDLPCVSKQQIDFFKKYLKVYPQQRGNTLKDGFYSKKRAND